MKHNIPITLLVLFLCVLPAAAAIQEVTVSGSVSEFSRANNTLTILNPAQYGCTYQANGTPVCSYTPLVITTLTGSVPDESAFSVFSPGDPIVATSLGGIGGHWIAIAKLYGTAPDKTVTNIVGDPSKVKESLAGDYSIKLSPRPDCNACSGTICTAAAANVSILDGKTLRSSGDLTPNGMSTYSGRNDGSSITVTFVKGQASSVSCSEREIMMTGPQPVSVYIVDVVPPIGSGGQAVQTPSATPSGTPPEVTMPADTRPAPTKSAMLPLAPIGAVALVAVLGLSRRV
ncbi:MAG: hypothetical protein LUQ35_05555 [Methanoregula sp.]|jgi:hypothetical protein|nr:hypothetical protein [Methanoregula sp.]